MGVIGLTSGVVTGLIGLTIGSISGGFIGIGISSAPTSAGVTSSLPKNVDFTTVTGAITPLPV